MPRSKPPPVEIITEQKPKVFEKRLSFTTQFTDVSRVMVRVEEEAFRASIPIVMQKIGGIMCQTYGVTVKSEDQAALDKFVAWFSANVPDLCDPRGFLGTGVKEYFK